MTLHRKHVFYFLPFAKGLTEIGTFATVHAERLVALVYFSVQRVEDQSVRTQFCRHHAVFALVEFVALHRILVLAVFFGTLELAICT